MSKRICSIQDCTRTVDAKGLCPVHYGRMRTHGDPLAGGRFRPQGTLVDRFYANIKRTDSCWLWSGYIDHTTGYGKICVAGRMVGAHRVSFQLATGEKPGRLHVDHTCHNRICVNPAHLRLVTPKQNAENRADRNRNSGVTQTKVGRWAAIVTHNYEPQYCGTFDTYEEAAEAARLKRCELFTHNDVDRIG